MEHGLAIISILYVLLTWWFYRLGLLKDFIIKNREKHIFDLVKDVNHKNEIIEKLIEKVEDK